MENKNLKEDQQAQACGTVFIWAILALIISIIVGANIEIPESTGFRRTVIVICSIIFGTPLGAIGGAIGDGLRKIAHPDAIFTTGGMGSILWAKIFWAIGPQVIGTVVGTLIGAGTISHLIIKYCFS